MLEWRSAARPGCSERRGPKFRVVTVLREFSAGRRRAGPGAGTPGPAVGWDGRAAFAELRLSIAVSAFLFFCRC
eukprot:183048-Hanusia_phi.AAC.1